LGQWSERPSLYGSGSPFAVVPGFRHRVPVCEDSV
jgi:hypothetical protein